MVDGKSLSSSAGLKQSSCQTWAPTVVQCLPGMTRQCPLKGTFNWKVRSLFVAFIVSMCSPNMGMECGQSASVSYNLIHSVLLGAKRLVSKPVQSSTTLLKANRPLLGAVHHHFLYLHVSSRSSTFLRGTSTHVCSG